MAKFKKIKLVFDYLNHAFERQFGWFFINGRKGEEEFNLELT